MALADAVLSIHIAYTLWVIFGVLFTRNRTWLAWIHIATIGWGIIVETTAAVCPLTLAENWFEARAGVSPYHGPFLLHYLDAILYPNIPAELLTAVAVLVCVFNLGIYAFRLKTRRSLA